MSKSKVSVLRDERGVSAIMFVVLLIPLIGMLGLAVDTTRAYSVQHRLQESIDAASLAGGKNFSDTNRDQIITDYFNANWKSGFLQTDTPTLTFTTDPVTRTVTVNAKVNMETIFMPVFGIDTVQVGTLASSVSGQTYLEVAIALDNTASMRNLSGSSRRIDLMKAAATDFVDALYTINGVVQNTVENMNVSLVPFTSLVNVGPQHTNFLVPGSLNGLVWDYPMNTTAQNSWRGCLFERSFYSDGAYNGRDVTDDSPTVEAFYPYHVPYPQISASTTCAAAPTCWPASYCKSGLQENCPDPLIPICTVQGACSTSPGLCTSGTAADDNAETACDTTRTWKCNGLFGGTPASCARSNGACNVNGVCGSLPNTCTTGTVTGSNGMTGCGTTTTWTCTGNGSGTSASCSYTNVSCTVNGSCGSTAGSCATGTKINDNNQTACETTRAWECEGSSGGSVASCSKANASCTVNGACSTTSGACSSGTVTGDNAQTACGTTRTWQCTGFAGGTTASCNKVNTPCSICFDIDGQPKDCKFIAPKQSVISQPSANIVDVSVPAGCRWGNAGVVSSDVVRRPAYSYLSAQGVTVQYYGLSTDYTKTYGYNALIPDLQNGAASPTKNLTGVSACCGYGVYGTSSDSLNDNMYAYAWEPWRGYTMNGRIIKPWPAVGTAKLGGWGNSGCGLPLVPLQPNRTDLIDKINEMDVPPVAAAGTPELGYGGTLINQGLVWAWRTVSPNWRGFWRHSNGTGIDTALPLDYATDGSSKAVVVMTDGLNFLPDRRARQGSSGPFFFAERPAQSFVVNDTNLSGGAKTAMSTDATFKDVDNSAYGLLRHNFDVTNTGLGGLRNPMSFCRQRLMVGNPSYGEPHLGVWGCREYDCMLRDSLGNCLRSDSPVSGSQGRPIGTFNMMQAISGPYYDELTTRLLQTCENMKSRGVDIYFVLFAIEDNPQKTAALAAFNSCVDGHGAVFDATDEISLNAAFQDIAVRLRNLRLKQ